MKRPVYFLLALVVSLFQPVQGAEKAAPVYIGFDGEYGLLNSTSAQAIELGIRLAMEEINAEGGVLGGRPLELISKDNRSVPARGVANLKEFAKQPDLVAVFGGRFSPVILQELDTIQELRLPLLDAWGSATGITFHDHKPSYTFRLSLYDRIAVPFMIEHALASGVKRLGLLLPNTGWGRSNQQEAMNYADAHGISAPPALWYNWGESDLLQYYQQLRRDGVDGILFVANDIEGAKLIRQLAERPREEWLPIVAHWGVTGGEMVKSSGEALFDIDFRVIQTFSFFTAKGPVAERVLSELKARHGIDGPAAIESPVGLAHAYDLTHILARAIDIAGNTDRAQIRDALEQVRDYRGLTGDYPQPFTAERHDALDRQQLLMARYRRDGAIVPLGYKSGAD